MSGLRDLYADLPALDCRGLCQDSCHDVPLLTGERDLLGDLGRDECPKLGSDGQCMTYDDRPLMCRLWGVVENMPCPHGCQPARMLTLAEGSAVVADAEQTAGPWLA